MPCSLSLSISLLGLTYRDFRNGRSSNGGRVPSSAGHRWTNRDCGGVHLRFSQREELHKLREGVLPLYWVLRNGWRTNLLFCSWKIWTAPDHGTRREYVPLIVEDPIHVLAGFKSEKGTEDDNFIVSLIGVGVSTVTIFAWATFLSGGLISMVHFH